MAILATDEKDQGQPERVPHIIGAVEILAYNAHNALPQLPNIRSITRKAIDEKAGKESAKDAAHAVKLYTPLYATVAPCDLCAEHERFGNTNRCADCIGREHAKLRRIAHRRAVLKREMTMTEVMVLMVCAGIAFALVVAFASPLAGIAH